MLSAMSALNASAQAVKTICAALQGVLDSKYTILPSVLLFSCWRRLVGQPHNPSDFVPAVRVAPPYTASLKAAKLVLFPHVPQGAV